LLNICTLDNNICLYGDVKRKPFGAMWLWRRSDSVASGLFLKGFTMTGHNAGWHYTVTDCGYYIATIFWWKDNIIY